MLMRWILMLKNFNHNKPLPPALTKKFEDYFEYFWKNDKNAAIATEEDQNIMRELPDHIKANIYKDFLFQDFLELFRVHFLFKKPEVDQVKDGLVVFFTWDDQQYSSFMIRICQSLEPRYYEQKEYIFQEGEDVDE